MWPLQFRRLGSKLTTIWAFVRSSGQFGIKPEEVSPRSASEVFRKTFYSTGRLQLQKHNEVRVSSHWQRITVSVCASLVSVAVNSSRGKFCIPCSMEESGIYDHVSDVLTEPNVFQFHASHHNLHQQWRKWNKSLHFWNSLSQSWAEHPPNTKLRQETLYCNNLHSKVTQSFNTHPGLKDTSWWVQSDSAPWLAQKWHTF